MLLIIAMKYKIVIRNIIEKWHAIFFSTIFILLYVHENELICRDGGRFIIYTLLLNITHNKTIFSFFAVIASSIVCDFQKYIPLFMCADIMRYIYSLMHKCP